MVDTYGRQGRWELRRGTPDYPSALEELEEPPKTLYGLGDPAVLHTRGIGIIGARRATPYGLAAASMAGRVAAESGITVVSGGAMGCDAAAARGALDAGGKTIVVAGTGADKIYPRSSRDVFIRAVEQGGAVISLEMWGMEPLPYVFPKRNKVIAALSEVLVVSEAGARSGTFSTALAANEMGRELYVVPGSIFSPESQGSNRLICDGASIIVSEQDLEARLSLDLGVLRLSQGAPATSRSRVMSALVASPMRVDELADHLAEQPLEMLKIIADYEAQGLVVRLADGRYSPTQTALLGT